MSRSMLAPVPAPTLGVSSLPRTRRTHPGCKLTPAQRIIAGHAFSSAAWLEQVAGAFSDPPALRCPREGGRERHVDDPSSRQGAGGAFSSVPTLWGLR